MVFPTKCFSRSTSSRLVLIPISLAATTHTLDGNSCVKCIHVLQRGTCFSPPPPTTTPLHTPTMYIPVPVSLQSPSPKVSSFMHLAIYMYLYVATAHTHLTSIMFSGTYQNKNPHGISAPGIPSKQAALFQPGSPAVFTKARGIIQGVRHQS